MPGTLEIGGELVETVLTFAPWLESVPVLGRILRLIAPGGGNDFKALEELQKQATKKKQDRDTRIANNARYVLKASDAMQCVEENLMTGSVWLSIGRAFIAAVAGQPSNEGGDLLIDRIFQCIESKVLKQTGRRRKKEQSYYGRPARGHGKGRAKRRSARR